jgi:hypothetical protein
MDGGGSHAGVSKVVGCDGEVVVCRGERQYGREM